ncbi:hypothetical protein MUG91_G97n6 [Manis pentadactyla]|nr:hypothetical protein MUG91_G97n6 [Manis pentadactyla]
MSFYLTEFESTNPEFGVYTHTHVYTLSLFKTRSFFHFWFSRFANDPVGGIVGFFQQMSAGCWRPVRSPAAAEAAESGLKNVQGYKTFVVVPSQRWKICEIKYIEMCIYFVTNQTNVLRCGLPKRAQAGRVLGSLR